MSDLCVRRDPDRSAEVARTGAGKFLDLLGGEGSCLETFVHERQVALENGLEDRPLLRGQVHAVQAFQGGLTARPEDLHRAVPRLVRGVGQVRGHELINGHAAVGDRFGELIDDGHRLGDQRFVAGAIEDHPAAALAEKGEDDRHPLAHVPLVLGQRALVNVHHGRVEDQDVLLGDRAFAGRLAVGNDDAQEFRHVAAVRRQAGESHAQEREAAPR